MILAAHLLNNYSGSPRVLAEALHSLKARGEEVVLFSSGGPGCLDELEVEKRSIPYRWHANRYVRLWRFMLSQLILMVRMFAFIRKDCVVYVNTLLPFGAALAGKIMGKKVIYHIHETHVEPAMLNRFLRFWVSFTASEVVVVSAYLAQKLDFRDVPVQVIPNALPADFVEQANSQSFPQERFKVLMIASLKKEKGLFSFVELARQLPDMDFQLVVGAAQEEVDTFFGATALPPNLQLLARQADVHPLYRQAHLLLNLSDPDLLPETFGMTILEAMAYGIPCIVPPVGGPAELVEEGVEGYQLDSRKMEKLVQRVDRLGKDATHWQQLSTAARARAEAFAPAAFQEAITQIVNSR